MLIMLFKPLFPFDSYNVVLCKIVAAKRSIVFKIKLLWQFILHTIIHRLPTPK